MDEGHIEIDSIEPIGFYSITPQLARESGFLGVLDLLKVAKHGKGDNIYLVRFHYVPPNNPRTGGKSARRRVTMISLTFSCLLALAPRLCSSAIALQGETVLSTQQNPLDYRIHSVKGIIKVPFELYGNNILLQVRINNSQPVLLIFDTGANVNVINQRLFDSLGLSATGPGNLAGAGGTVQGKVAEGATISLPGLLPGYSTPKLEFQIREPFG